MGIPVLSVGSAAKWRATLRGSAASLHATTGRMFVTPDTPVDPRRTLAVRTVGTIEGEGA
ncbi:DUF6380 family protein [Streptomyces sp. NPDC050095]|uniref:DUF6380 family protein n=1 Tax=unclassified Streptomyces TaxID=2593676 RepID=UPI003420B97D